MNVKIALVGIVALAAAGAVHPSFGAGSTAPAHQVPAAAGQPSVWDGVYTEAQSKRGEVVYRQECSTCHGHGLMGIDEAPALTGAGFTSNWNGFTVGDLFERIRISMPPDTPGKLSRSQIADVLAYILSVGKFPVGTSELAQQTERLKMIQFVATKP